MRMQAFATHFCNQVWFCMNTEQTTFSAVLGVVLSNLRKERGVEQGEMAERMGISQASYSRLESGKSAFSIDQMYQAAESIGLTSDELTGRLNTTIDKLRNSGVKVVPQLRGNSSQAKKEGGGVSSFVVGAALGGVLVGLLSQK